MLQLNSTHPTFTLIVSVYLKDEPIRSADLQQSEASQVPLETTIPYYNRIVQLHLLLSEGATKASVECAKLEADSFLYFLSTNNLAHVPIFQHPQLQAFWEKAESLFLPPTG